MSRTDTPAVTTADRRGLASAFGIREPSDGERLTLEEIREAIRPETDPEFASIGEAIREDLADELNSELLDEALAEMERRIERLPAVRETGIPEGATEPEKLYRSLLPPAWVVYNHLAEVEFFDSAEENLPTFTAESIERTARELIQTDATTALSDYGFSDREQTVLMMNVVNNNTRLSRWVPTKDIPEDVEFTVDYVPPLHQRAMGGALLWINALDRHLWQKEILITDQILDDAFWHTKAMLAGLYVMARAARAVAGGDGSELTDAQTTAALTAGTAMLIVNQEELMKSTFWITEEKRAPSRAR